MKYHAVHSGKDWGDTPLFWDHEEDRNLHLSESANLLKQKVGTPSDADIIAMFSPYANASGEAFSNAGNAIEETVPSVSVNTTQPASPIKGKADAGDYNYGVLFAANDVYTATAGDTHEAVMYLSHTASSVKWYVDETLLETDSNTDEPRLSWNIPDDASGDYVIKAEVTPATTASYEASYTVSVSLLTVLDAPTNLYAYGYNGWVSLSFSYPNSVGGYPSSDGGATITDYEYRYSVTDGTYSDWTSWGNTYNLNSVYNLTNGVQYQFQVRAVNSLGVSTESNTAYATPVDVSASTVPDAPTILNACGYYGWVSLSFSDPSSDGGATITDYEYRYSVTDGTYSDWTSWGNTYNLNSVYNLTNGVQYQFQVRAVNSEGEGTESNTAYATPVAPSVWSSIPDPYRLSVGECFRLDLSSYVTGSPTITLNGGTIPAGLSLSNGVLSGTVTSVETQNIIFTATNAWGHTADSESIRIIITTRPP